MYSETSKNARLSVLGLASIGGKDALVSEESSIIVEYCLQIIIMV
jgi:hypothetical protein